MWGGNAWSQLGHTSDNAVPVHLPLPLDPNERVTQIILGGLNSACLTSKNRLFAWGCNANGQLGLRHKNQQRRPTEVSIHLNPGEIIKQMCLSNLRSSIMTSHGRTLVCDFPPIANEDGDPVENVETRNGYREFNCPHLRHNEFIVATAIGLPGIHRGVFTSQNRLILWGYNTQGQLGSGNTTNLTLETANIIDGNEFFSEQKVISVEALSTSFTYGDDEPRKQPHLASLYYFLSKNASRVKEIASVSEESEIDERIDAGAASSSRPTR